MPYFALCGICLREWGTDTNSTLKETQGICEGLLRFQIQYDIIILTNLNLTEEIIKDNREIVIRFFDEGYTNKNYDYIMQHVSEDYYDHSPAGARSNKAAVEILKIVAQQFSDLKITVLDAFSQGNMVATRVLYEGVHTGECMGIAPTGKRICFEALENFRLEDGKIVESWGYWPDKEIERILR